jgi:hypothetical protein
MAELLRRRLRRVTVNLVRGQGRLGCTGAMLETGLDRFLQRATPTRG